MQQQLRTKVWKALLGVYKINAQEYIQLVRRGPSPMMDKIQNDTFRTLKTDEDFTNNVSQDSLTRLLNAFVWKAMDQPVSRLVNMRFSYVQGMNVLAAPFLYVMPELDAYSLFSSFLHHSCPLYVQPNLEGVHCGVKLVDHCLEELDPELYKHLIKHNLSAQVYAFPYIMTFSACVPPLDQVLVLWDFYFAFGMHLNVLGVVSQVVLMRQQLLNSDSPMKLLRTLPDLNAKKIIDKVLVLASSLDEDLYDLCVRHPFDPTIYDALFPGEF
ncbi:rab-GTPase-TBC domain-containing protein [Gorgonomyces haynaldii]|nr:rab-GTPase-TBC domain-containing protein [Gorgonomyces haynaldii]